MKGIVLSEDTFKSKVHSWIYKLALLSTSKLTDAAVGFLHHLGFLELCMKPRRVSKGQWCKPSSEDVKLNTDGCSFGSRIFQRWQYIEGPCR
ncbi:hypothetical protein REPUB_Repub12eG0036100 [Reevesia pubescens]